MTDEWGAESVSRWTVPGYHEHKVLGRGASGLVVLARHERTGSWVAIKYLNPELVSDRGLLSVFRAESLILQHMDSAFVTRLYEYVESSRGAAIVMEFVNGVSVRALLRADGPLEPRAALAVLRGSLLGLATAHERGLVHRDYKPENVLVDDRGWSKLADFGIAAPSGQQGVPAGTPTYMAPEQWALGDANPQTDIYAAVVTFFECVTGRPPYAAPGDPMQLRRLHEEELPPLELLPPELRELTRRGLAKFPANRPGDATTLLRELDRVAFAAYGDDWEREGRKELSRRVLLLLVLLPPLTAAGQSRWARWSRSAPAKTVGAGAAGVAVIVTALLGWDLADSSDADFVPPPQAVAPSYHPVPLSAPPSPPPSVSPSPSAGPATPSPAATPGAGPSSGPARPPSARPSASPTPTVSAFGLVAEPYCVGTDWDTCWRTRWSASVLAGGRGPATLHVGMYPVDESGVVAGNPSVSWRVDFNVTRSGRIDWNDDSRYSVPIDQSCAGGYSLVVRARITVGSATVATDEVRFSCVIIQ
ncbi:serine/threonine-protein kinase [Catellatospora aurea]|uniref:non-specific serine/threonine protein kinase n=1 Tax=Catellatospora aurea TaxID=1337874 RepID=A0ABW2H895_9ACTN